MLRLRPILSSKFSRIRNLNKFYSKSFEQLERALSLSDALGAHTQTTAKPVVEVGVERNIDFNLTSTDKSITEISKAGETGVVGCEKAAGKVDADTKRGSKCGNPKPMQPQDPGPPGGYDEDKCDIYDMPKPNAKKWRTISYVLVPFAFGLSAFVLATREEGPEPEYIPYEYMYRRTRRFPWGDGKTSFFHGPNNFIPQEEEQRLAEEQQIQGGENAIRYKKRINEEEEKKKRREQHAKEELERRKKRHESQ